MESRAGAFIVIEGVDGSGKSTQFDLLAERLRAGGHDVATFKFPRYDDPSSYFVREYLTGKYGNADDVGPYTASLFYALDRYAGAEAIREALAAGKIVLIDRYAGSNMAHQGAKFHHAEQRRGYFIWLDNLEFEMLHIPRPNLNFVLTMPPKISQELLVKSGKARDIHEADLEHLQRSAEVYSDLTQLFPKDFTRIDCVRGGELLSVEQVHHLLWEKLAPLLPKATARAETKVEQPDAASTPSSEAKSPRAYLHVAAENVSALLAAKLESIQPEACLERPVNVTLYDQKDGQGKYHYVVPRNLTANVDKQYRKSMDELFGLYASMVRKLAEHIAATSGTPGKTYGEAWRLAAETQARNILRAVLPVAAQTTVDVFASNETLENFILELQNDALPEAREIGADLREQARQQISDFMQHYAQPKRTGGEPMQVIAKKELAGAYAAGSTESVALVDYWPRNELNLVADMLYANSDLPLTQIQTAVNAWPYAKKAGALKAYLSEQNLPHRALEKTRYDFDLVSEFSIFKDLQRQCERSGLEWQQLSPRNGFDVPIIVDDAGLTEQFETCFDISLQLHSLLQASGFPLEAQYATLQGHKLRWKASYNATEVFRLPKSHAHKLAQQIQEKIAEAHPLIAETLQSKEQPDVPKPAP